MIALGLVYALLCDAQRTGTLQAPGLVYSFPYNAELRQERPIDAALDHNGFLWLLNEQRLFLFESEKFIRAYTVQKGERFIHFSQHNERLLVRSSTRLFDVITGQAQQHGLKDTTARPPTLPSGVLSRYVSEQGSVHELLLNGALISIRSADTTTTDVTKLYGEGLFGLRLDEESRCFSDKSDNVWVVARNELTLILASNPILEGFRFREDQGKVYNVLEKPDEDRLVVLCENGIFVYTYHSRTLIARFHKDHRGARIRPIKLIETDQRFFIYATVGMYELHLDEPRVQLLVNPRRTPGRIAERSLLNYIAKDPSSETIFLGTKDNEIIVYDISTGSTTVYPILPENEDRPFNLVFEIVFFSNGNAIIHGEAGVFYMDRASMQFSLAKDRWPNLEWSPWFNPSGIQLIADTLLLVAAFNDNMLIYNFKNDSIYAPQNVRERKFHISDTYWDGMHHVFCASKEGIVVYDIKSNLVDVYGARHGFDHQGQYYRYLNRGSNGTIFLGSDNGYFKMSALTLAKASDAPDFVTDIVINGTKYTGPIYRELGSTLNLPQDKNSISLRQITPTYAPRKSRDRVVRLLGREDGWEQLNAMAPLVYSALPSGTFTLLEKRLNGPTIEIIDIVIAKPIWKRTWFIVAVALLLGSLLYLAYRNRIAAARQKERIRFEYSEQIRELEIRSLRQQMDPHFIFNSLNSIKSYIADNEPSIAIDYLNKFAQLIRLILNNSSQTLVDLKSEMRALELFVDLERLRFNDSFDFQINIADDVDLEDIQIPPTIFQPYVENAIWHGLMQKEGKRELTISISVHEDELIAKVRDNGIGREQAKERSSKMAKRHRSLGMQITGERIERGSGDRPGSINVSDIHNADGQIAGTEVLIQLPI